LAVSTAVFSIGSLLFMAAPYQVSYSLSIGVKRGIHFNTFQKLR
jgi:hypothetical protein